MLSCSSQAGDRGKFDFTSVGAVKKAAGVPWSKKVHQGYSLKVWLSNAMTMGIQAWDPSPVPLEDCSVGIGAEYPGGSCIEHLFGAGPWIGGIINGRRYVDEGYNGDDARTEFIPERWDTARDRIWHTHTGIESYDSNGYSGYYLRIGQQVNRRGFDDDADNRVDEDPLDGLDNDGDWSRDPVTHQLLYDDHRNLIDDLGADGLSDSLEVSCDGAVYDRQSNPDPAYDNYDTTGFDHCRLTAAGNYTRKFDKNVYTQNNGMPDHGEPHVDEDYGAVSDRDYYLTATDTFKSYSVGGHVPMGIKVVERSYAWDGDVGEAILPFDFTFINVGNHVINDVYLGFFVDIDIGPVDVIPYYAHNYVCWFPDINTAYGHNAMDRGSTPLGLTFLGGSKPLRDLNFVYQWQGFRDGTTDSLLYSWMNGEAFPNQTVKPCQSPFAASDTRFFFFSGPFGTLDPGDSARLSVALVSGDEVDDGPNSLRSNAIHAIELYRRGYQPRVVPPSPPLRLKADGSSVVLNWKWHPGDPGLDPLETWDDSSQLASSPYSDTTWRRINPPCNIGPHKCVDGKMLGGRIFEGYKVWRSEASVPDAQSFALLAQYGLDPDPVFGVRTGLETTYTDSHVRLGRDYWYAVTSYSIVDGVILERRDSTGAVIKDTILTGSTESGILDNAQQIHVAFGPSARLGEVRVVPNPYLGDAHYTDGNGFEGDERTWSEDRRVIWFTHLPERATIRIYTISGDIVTTMEHDDARRTSSGQPVGQEEFRLFSGNGEALSSGLYVFTVESRLGTQTGKFAIIK